MCASDNRNRIRLQPAGQDPVLAIIRNGLAVPHGWTVVAEIAPLREGHDGATMRPGWLIEHRVSKRLAQQIDSGEVRTIDQRKAAQALAMLREDRK